MLLVLAQEIYKWCLVAEDIILLARKIILQYAVPSRQFDQYGHYPHSTESITDKMTLLLKDRETGRTVQDI